MFSVLSEEKTPVLSLGVTFDR